MKIKQFLVWGVLLILLLGGLLLFKKRGLPKSQSRTENSAQLQPLGLKQTERIQIERHPGPPRLLTIVKAWQGEKASWRIPDLGNEMADGQKLDRLLVWLQEIAEDMKEGKGSSASDLQGSEEFFRVSLYDGGWNPLFVVLIGKDKDPAGRFWVRQEGSEVVYWTGNDLPTLVQDSFVEAPSVP